MRETGKQQRAREKRERREYRLREVALIKLAWERTPGYSAAYILAHTVGVDLAFGDSVTITADYTVIDDGPQYWCCTPASLSEFKASLADRSADDA
jgi:hypothetical protein